MQTRATTLLVVLDGWGLRHNAADNAIGNARTPTWDRLWAGPAKTALSASGGDVGLPDGQMGNSEVGHMSIGAGRVVWQDLTRIGQAIASGSLAQDKALAEVIELSTGGTLHVLGLLSPGGVHSHEDHIAALIDIAAQHAAPRIRLHAFLDGRDTPPKSALASLQHFETNYPGVIASLTGRFFAMDRDRRWDRTERAYNLLARGEAPFHFESAVAALEAAYTRGETDEFVQPSAIHPLAELPVKLSAGDAAVFMNFRADRARQLTRALVDDNFDGFKRRSRAAMDAFVTLTRYAEDIGSPVLFAPQQLGNTLGETLAGLGRTQLRIAETEKYAHVTYFFSGGREQPFDGEDRLLVPSPSVATYDTVPEMSARAVTDRLIGAIDAGEYDFVVCNYANGDMVGHTGDFDAAVQAVETIDGCLARVLAALERTGSECLITADHGNVESMRDVVTSQPHTAHTSNAVPLVYAGGRNVRFADRGSLADVAPTLLDLMGLAAPDAMTGRSLLTSADVPTAAAELAAS